MFSGMLRLLKRIPLAVQAMVLTLLVGTTVWLVLDVIQGRGVRDLLLHELSDELNDRAKEDRRVFDRHVQGIHHAAKLIVEQRRFWDYLDSPDWKASMARPEALNHFDLPPWMPRPSILRSFFYAQHALLIDADGVVREIYHYIPHLNNEDDLPASLVQPGELLQLLSHNQSYMTSRDGKAVVVAVRQAQVGDEVKATLMLMAFIDDEFLYEARRRFDTGNIMVLLDSQSERVVATSDQELAPTGTLIEQLKKNFLMIGKDQTVMPKGSFFDYGASDLDLRFLSLVPTDDAHRLANLIQHKNNQQRTLLAVALLVVFLIVILGMVHRIRSLTQDVVNFTKGKLGGMPLEIMRGDELSIMESQFKNLSDEVLQSQARIQAHADERVELIRRAAEAEQRQRELESLRSVTETLGVGIIFEGEDGPVAFNSLMEDFASQCGGIEQFLLDQDYSSRERVLLDAAGVQRTFVVDRHASLGERGTLVRDVTLSRQIEHSRNQLLSILDETTDFVGSADIDGNVLYINKGGRRLIGIGEDEGVTNLKMWDLHPIGIFKRINEMGLPCAREYGAWVGETAFLTRGGSEVVTSQVILAHRDSQGELEYYSTIARDISEQKKMESELQQANEGLRQEIKQRELIERDLKAAIQAADEANRAKGEFLANMSHEIRTPMQAIIGMTDMLNETDLDQQQSSLVTTLEHAGNSLLEIVNNILDLSKIEAGKIELQVAPFTLVSVIDAVMRICSFKADEKNLKLSSSIASDIPTTLLGDRVYLQQVLINLMDNAIKFTEQGVVQVTVAMGLQESCRNVEEYDGSHGKCCLQFSVRDTGSGIAKEVQEKIFDAFVQADASTTRRFGGTGLGTTISKRIVEKMGGEIWVRSKPGRGSTFYFTAEFGVPLEAVSSAAEAGGAKPEAVGPLHILVAEDSEDIRLLIKTYLGTTDHQLDLVENGLQAVEHFRAGDYDLIFMDMEMPEMDGYTAVREIRSLEASNPGRGEVPIVALTAHALSEHERRSLEAGCNGHVTKPIKKAQLLSLIGDFTRAG